MQTLAPTSLLALLFYAQSLAAAPERAGSLPEHDDVRAPLTEQGAGHAPCENGVSGGYPCRNVELLARLPAVALQGEMALDSWGWRDPLTGRHYALVAMDNGVSFVDVTDPEAPVYLGRLPTARLPSPEVTGRWRDLKTYRNHAYIVADRIAEHGMQVFDLERLRDVSAPPVQFDADAHYDGFGPAHNLAINQASGFAIVAGSDTCDGGLHLVDIRDPAAPSQAGCFGEDGYTHDVQCVDYHGPDPDYQGQEICFASNKDALAIVDISDKAAAFMVGKTTYPNAGYAHQGWLSDDHRYFILGDEMDEISFGSNTRTLVFDVSELERPTYAGAHFSGSTTIDHNLYVRGDYIYQANYTAGLRILQIEDLADAGMREVAYFDTVPQSDQLAFDGAWNVYPFFDDGTLLVSDMSSGLFLLRADLPPVAGGPIDGRMSGAWVAEGLNDQGLTLLVGENIHGPVVFIAWFLYLGGEPFWLTGSTRFEMGAEEITVPLQRLRGLGFLSRGDDLAERADIGSLRIHAHGCDRIHAEYDLGEGLGAGEMDMRPVIGVEGRECAEAR